MPTQCRAIPLQMYYKEPAFDIQIMENITPNVLISLDRESGRKLEAIDRLEQVVKRGNNIESVKWMMALGDGPICKNF